MAVGTDVAAGVFCAAAEVAFVGAAVWRAAGALQLARKRPITKIVIRIERIETKIIPLWMVLDANRLILPLDGKHRGTNRVIC